MTIVPEAHASARRADPSDTDVLAQLRWTWRAVERGERGDPDQFRRDFEAWVTEHRGTHVPFVVEAGGCGVGMAWLVIIERIPGPEKWTRLSGLLAERLCRTRASKWRRRKPAHGKADRWSKRRGLGIPLRSPKHAFLPVLSPTGLHGRRKPVVPRPRLIRAGKKRAGQDSFMTDQREKGLVRSSRTQRTHTQLLLLQEPSSLRPVRAHSMWQGTSSGLAIPSRRPDRHSTI